MKVTGFRWEMVEALVGQGFSYRAARKAVKVIFEAITSALLRGEDVELPIGTLRVVPNPEPSRRRIRFRNRIAQYGRARRIVVLEARP